MAVVSCLHPIVVRNSSGIFRVPCGKCEACLNLKGSSLALQCDVEESCSKFCYFVTLTYSDDFLPLCRVQKYRKTWVFSDVTRGRNAIGNLGLYENSRIMAIEPLMSFDDAFFSDYNEKLHLPYPSGIIPYLSRRDVQLFLKRLRKSISNITDEKIRLYYCGEYGPVHFRPHYHLLLWFDSSKVAENIRDLVPSCWKYGRVDVQLSKGKCSGYVAKYVNSFSRLSAVQRLKAFSPFTSHSVHLGQQLCEVDYQEVETCEYGRVGSSSVTVNGKVKPLTPWLALQDSRFPKCYRYGSSDSECRLFCYTFYRRLSQEVGESKVSLLANAAFEDFDNHTQFLRCVSEFRSIYGKDDISEQTFLSILYVSRKFLKLCQDYNVSERRLLRCIEYYYDSKDYFKLASMYQEQCDFIDTYGVSYLPWLSSWYDLEPISSRKVQEYLSFGDFLREFERTNFFVPKSWRNELEALDPFYYPDHVLKFFDSLHMDASFYLDTFFGSDDFPLYRQFADRSVNIYNDSMKHKKLNDLNKVFCYGKHNVSKKR